jgi:hypothetical protein
MCMRRWEHSEGTVAFGVPATAMLEHADGTLSAELLNEFADYDSDRGTESDEDFGDGPFGNYTHKVWWWEDRDCDRESCSCGRLSLLAALEYLDNAARTEAVRLHADEMRSLFEHFWAGQGMVSGASESIGEACAECIVSGAEHVWEVYGNACELAEELGEALAAYAYDLFVGEPRFRQSDN